MAADKDYDPKMSYIVSQVAHISCKKDTYEILFNTVTDRLSAGYEKLQSSALVFVKAPAADSKVKAVFLSKHAFNIKLEQDIEDEKNAT